MEDVMSFNLTVISAMAPYDNSLRGC
jgi:hypothetical protein